MSAARQAVHASWTPPIGMTKGGRRTNMLEKWSQLGFVVPKTVAGKVGKSKMTFPRRTSRRLNAMSSCSVAVRRERPQRSH